MPSPFPGMDPYLEDPAKWPDFHQGMIFETKAALTRDLRPRYYARVEERVYISDETDPGRRAIVPDVRVVESRPLDASTEALHRGASAIAEPVVLTTLIEDEIHEPRVEIIDAEQRRVVTVIELLSPTNKIAGARGRTSFLQKCAEVMHSSSHWVEIDLLRAGERLAAREALPPGDYIVHVSRTDSRPKGYVWAFPLSQRLPLVPIPLLPGDEDYPLDLQAIFDTVYDRSAYDLEIDNAREPVPPLAPADAQWADALLREAGKRT